MAPYAPDSTNDGKIITAGECFFKAQHLCSMQVDTNWYWNKQPKHHVIAITTHTIILPQLEVNAVTDFHAIPTSVCTRTQAKHICQYSLYI